MLLLLPSLLLVPTLTMAFFLLLLVSSVLSLTIATISAISTYLTPLIVAIPDIQEPALQLTPTTIKQKLEFMQIKGPTSLTLLPNTAGYLLSEKSCTYCQS